MLAGFGAFSAPSVFKVLHLMQTVQMLAYPVKIGTRSKAKQADAQKDVDATGAKGATGEGAADAAADGDGSPCTASEPI